MKRLIFSIIPIVILALVVAGCASTSQEDTVIEDAETLQEEAGGALLETPTTEVAEEAGTTMTEEDNTVAEEADAAATEEDDTVAEEADVTATEDGDTASEEAQADTTETTPSEDSESAQADAAAEEAEVIPPTGAVNLNRMSNLLDFEVWNRNDEQVGDVNAIVINQDTSQIEYVIVGSGGFLGIGEQELPVPWSVLQLEGAAEELEAESSTETGETQAVETPQNVFILNITAEELEQASEFDLTPLYESQETADTMSLEQLEQEIHAFWQSEQMTQTSGPKNLVLAEDLRYATIQQESAGLSEQPTTDQQETTDQMDSAAQQAPEQSSLGQVEEIMVDVNAGKVTYLLVSLDSAPGSMQKAPAGGDVQEPALDTSQESYTGDVPLATIQVVPVPLEVLEWNAKEAALMYTGSEFLMEAPTVSFDEIESDSSNWKSQADSFWDLESDDAEIQDTENQ